MSNQALPTPSLRLVEQYGDRCLNLGLMLDKFAPWGEERGQWDLVMHESVRRRGQTTVQPVSGGQAKGLWLSTSREAKRGETRSLFEDNRTDTDLMQAKQNRWQRMIQASGGIAFSMRLTERMAAGLGASHVLETGLTLDRNTGLPYLPGSTVKGLARAWGLIKVASQFGIVLTEANEAHQPLNKFAQILIETSPADLKISEGPSLPEPIADLLKGLPDKEPPLEDAMLYLDYFRFIFGSQSNGGAISFLDGVYYGQRAPRYAADVMTPHFVAYYTGNGSKPPADDDNPNPVSFLTVNKGNTFAFGLLPRQSAFAGLDILPHHVLVIARDWLINALAQLGAGSKTAAGYGFFSKKSAKLVVGSS